MDTLRELVAGELRATLARKRISAAELARRLGWSQTYMARRVDGRAAIDMDDLEAIANVLQMPVTALLPARFPLNDRSPASPVRTTLEPRPALTRPKGRPVNAATRPASSGPPTRRRPVRIDRPASR